MHSLLHTGSASWRWFGGARAERIPGPSEVAGALKAEPDGLRSGRIVSARMVHVATELCQQANHRGQLRRCGGQRFVFQHPPHGFPFSRLEDGFAIQVTAAPTQPADHQGAPSHDQVHGHARKKTVDLLEPALFNSATRFQHSEQDLDHEPHRIVLHDLPDLLDGKRRSVFMCRCSQMGK